MLMIKAMPTLSRLLSEHHEDDAEQKRDEEKNEERGVCLSLGTG
jgi:hypothetical protein